jgi:predicted regulator of Ras-like GTPase activity (Roadblock/LC7/MglB family)
MFNNYNSQNIQKTTSVILKRIVNETGALAAFLVDDSGFLIDEAGSIELDRVSLSALVSATFGATAEVARILGEPDFSRLTHQGNKRNLYIGRVGKKHILTIVFDSETNLGLVKLYAEQFSDKLLSVLEEDHSQKETSDKNSV